MYISLLRLINYKRFKRSGIKSFEWTPTKQLMLIVGSNGSGKSSLRDELSPYPSHHRNFSQGGSKELHCYHNGHQYIVKSVYNHGTGSHSFIRDDEELNSGGTFKIQEDLCFQEFGLTKEFLAIITGRTRFTELSTADRRKILTKMSVVKLDEAFDVFHKLRQEARSQKGTVDTINKRLVDENHDISSDAELDIMRNHNKSLNQKLNELFTARQPNVKPGFRDENEAAAALVQLVERAKNVLYSYPRTSPGFKTSTEAEYSEQKQLIANQCSAVEAVIQQMTEELEHLRGANTADFEVSPEQISALESELAALRVKVSQDYQNFEAKQPKLPLVKMDITNYPQQRLDAMFDRWMKSINAFPNNAEGYISRSGYNDAIESAKQLTARHRELDKGYQTASQRLNRLKGCDHVKCVKCDHVFTPGVDESEIPKLEDYLTKCGEKMEELTLELKQREEYIELFNEYRVHVSNFAHINSEYSDFSVLWDHLADSQVMFRTPKALLLDAVEWHETMGLYIKAMEGMRKVELLEARLAKLKEIDSDAVAYTRKRMLDLEHSIADRYRDKVEVQTLYRSLNDTESAIKTMNTELVRLVNEYADWRSRAMQHAEWLLDKAFEAEISDTQLALAEGTRRLNVAEQRENSIRVLENEVNNAREVASDLNLLIKALSPNGGLLGKYLMGFMQGVVSYVNAYIGEVWTYPMEVMPSKIDKDELDYNFPLNVSNGAVVADDISLGSDSQLEMVDFSFTQAMRKFLGFEDYPLYLDEFGRTFDEQHRANLIPFISRLIENGAVKQVFYISHFISTHGAFNNAEYLVLDPTNITVPVNYNKNAVIL